MHLSAMFAIPKSIRVWAVGPVARNITTLARQPIFVSSARGKCANVGSSTMCARRIRTRYSKIDPFHKPKSLHTGETFEASIKEPSERQLRILALRTAIPMIGFGAMDNFVMLQAGDLIDTSIGVTFALSTLTAAGFGQVFSDVAGITCGGIVDAIVAKLKLPYHNLSREQLNLRKSRICSTLGGCIGVVTGCLLGMTCLFFMDTQKADRLKKAQELTSIFVTVVEDGHKIVDAERATIWLLDQEKQEIWSKVSTGLTSEIRIASSSGIVGSCIETGNVINIQDAYSDARFNPEVDKKTGYLTRSIVAVPVFGKDGAVIGAIQMINKKPKDENNPGIFTEDDIKLLRMMSSHVSTFIQIVNGT